MAEVTLRDVHKHFDEVAAVDGIDLDVADGEFVVLLGPTGAGKTTTLRLIAGLEKPDQGEVRIGGRDVTGEPPAARDLAFVFQQYSLYPHMTAWDNLAFPLRAPGRRVTEGLIREKVAEIAGLLRIDHKLESKATELSGGEMQRVAVARAIIHKPRLILADEPTGNLDSENSQNVLGLISELHEEDGFTVVMATHDQMPLRYATRRVGITDGRLEEGC